jgi:hypothetical protein
MPIIWFFARALSKHTQKIASEDHLDSAIRTLTGH